MAVGRSELGVGIRAGASKPDIRTVATFKQTLREAPSITYPQDGASRGYIEHMCERLGIAAEVKPKIILAPESGPATESVAAGKAAMVLTLFSEIVPTHGAEILGPFPGEYQSDMGFGAASSAKSTQADAASALIGFLAGPRVTPGLKAKGHRPSSRVKGQLSDPPFLHTSVRVGHSGPISVDLNPSARDSGAVGGARTTTITQAAPSIPIRFPSTPGARARFVSRSD